MAHEVDVVVLSGNPKVGSRTLRVGEAVAAEIERWLDERGHRPRRAVIELGTLAGGLFDWEDEAANDAMAQVQGCDLLVVASPTYKATYTGLLKAFLDRTPSDGLRGLTAVPVMVGAAPVHWLAPDTMLRPLLSELGATCPVHGLFVMESQLDDLEKVVGQWVTANEHGLGVLLHER